MHARRTLPKAGAKAICAGIAAAKNHDPLPFRADRN